VPDECPALPAERRFYATHRTPTSNPKRDQTDLMVKNWGWTTDGQRKMNQSIQRVIMAIQLGGLQAGQEVHHGSQS